MFWWLLIPGAIPAAALLGLLANDYRNVRRLQPGARFWIREWPHIVLEVCERNGDEIAYGQVVNGVGQPNYRCRADALSPHIVGWL